MRIFKSTVTLSPHQVQLILEQAFRAAAENFSVRAAQLWGKNFQFSSALLQRDLADFVSCDYDLARFCHTRHQQLASRRLSVTRVLSAFGPEGKRITGVCTADFDTLLGFAERGVPIIIPHGFIPCPTPPTLRQKYQDVAVAVNKLFDKQHSKGQLLILPVTVAQQIPGIHFSPQHWTEKKGKPQGRPIGDLSNADTPGTTPLNGDGNQEKALLRDRIEQTWSPIHHPTLQELMLMVLSMTDKHGWDQLVLWKKDLQGAFNLLWFSPDCVKLLAFLLTGGLVVLHLAGIFGWAGMPHAFAVVTRCVIALVRAVVRGEACMYVDDIMGITLHVNLHHDMGSTDTAVSGLLGPDAIATDKDETGRRLEWIGWDVDLDTKLVTLSHRNLLKTIHVFFSFDVRDPIPRAHVEAMASLASRCSMLARQMRPYTRALHEFAASFGAAHSMRVLPSLARTDVFMWRAFLLASHFDEHKFARPIESFRQRPPTYVIEYDSSLTAFAVGLSSLDSVSGKLTLVAATSMLSPFAPTVESRKQNTYEYLAVLIGILMAKHLKLRSFTYRLLGDSVSSLKWAFKDRAASVLARRANIGLTLVSVDIDASVSETEHVKGEHNVVFDGLSRGKTMTEVGLDPSKWVSFPMSHPIHQYITLCDPDLELESYAAHTDFAATLLALLALPTF